MHEDRDTHHVHSIALALPSSSPLAAKVIQVIAAYRERGSEAFGWTHFASNQATTGRH